MRPQRKTGVGLGRRTARKKNTTPATPMRRQRAEMTQIGRGVCGGSDKVRGFLVFTDLEYWWSAVAVGWWSDVVTGR